MRKSRVWMGPALLGFLLVAGCIDLGGRTPPTRFFLLVAGVPTPNGMEHPDSGALVVVERPLLPAYLNRPQLVSYQAPGEVVIAPFSRWAEPLDVGMARVLAENLQRLWPATRVVAGEVPPGGVSPLRLRMQVQRFEGGPGREAHLEAFWSLVVSEQGVWASGTFRFAAPWSGGEDALAAVLSSLLADAARDIAAAGEPRS